MKPGETIEEIQIAVSNCVTRSTRECPALKDGGSIRGGGKAYLKERLIALQLIIFPSSNHSCLTVNATNNRTYNVSLRRNTNLSVVSLFALRPLRSGIEILLFYFFLVNIQSAFLSRKRVAS